MSTTDIDPTDTPDAAHASLPDIAARLHELLLAEATLNTLEKRVSDAHQAARGATQDLLATSGIEKISTALPNTNRKIASITAVAATSVATVTDREAFTAWVAEHSPHNVTTRTITVTEVQPAYVTVLLDEMSDRGAAEAADPDTGVITTVPGVTMRERRAYHSVRFAKGARDALTAAWNAGDLSHLEGLRALATGTAVADVER